MSEANLKAAAWLVSAVSFEIVTKDEALVRMLSKHSDEVAITPLYRLPEKEAPAEKRLWGLATTEEWNRFWKREKGDDLIGVSADKTCAEILELIQTLRDRRAMAARRPTP